MRFRTAVTVAAISLLAACGSGAPPGGSSSAVGSSAPASGPQRIVSLSPTATETLFEIGAGQQVVAVDDQSNHPADAPRTKLSGYEPNVEAIVGYQPDLVVIADDTKKIEAQLSRLGIEVIVAPPAKTLDEAYQQIEQLGVETGHADAATGLVEQMRDRVAELTKELAPRPKPLTYYHELDNTLYTVTSKTFLGQVYTLAGLRNVADPADKAGGGYPQLSAEYLVKADPDLVFLGDTKCCAQNAATFAKRPGFANLKAVRGSRVIPLDDDIASRWGPRIVDLLETIVSTVEAVPAS
ncbi:MAG TPA: ABC transporter substrate-binding protein [Mycobacteriales bacterium]|nr:ABC transporter substrate-binding protein [Mycobacteriales bacterium]